ncbi:unnamed protein product [Phaeothamnion confervicola]
MAAEERAALCAVENRQTIVELSTVEEADVSSYLAACRQAGFSAVASSFGLSFGWSSASILPVSALQWLACFVAKAPSPFTVDACNRLPLLSRFAPLSLC